MSSIALQSVNTHRSPVIIERIESFLTEDGRKALEVNQVLINEYQADQGISVCLFPLGALQKQGK